MYEVEVKVPADFDRVRAHLDQLDAAVLGSTEQTDSYYDHPSRSFPSTDEALRVRRESSGATLTYKGPKVDAASKTRRELETGLLDPEAANDILLAIGFEPVAEVRKTRERYAVREFTVNLDTVEELGEFVEVETVGGKPAIEELRRGAFDLLERLGLDPAEQVRASYLELLRDASE